MTEPETDEQRADRLETERSHAAGNHAYCDVTCETESPSETLRNFILAKGYPGTGGALDELLRRAAIRTATGQDQPDTDRIALCICGHTEAQHFEDACVTEITGCTCGDYLEPQAAAEVIDRWRQATIQARAELELARGAALTEAADALVAKAGELSELAEEEMRSDLEETAQEWHQAADVVRRLTRPQQASRPQPETGGLS